MNVDSKKLARSWIGMMLADPELADIHEELRAALEKIAEASPVTREHCRGCYDECYHGQLAEKCWNFDGAKLQRVVLVPVELAPPYDLPAEERPSCYKKQRFATMTEEQIRRSNEAARR